MTPCLCEAPGLYLPRMMHSGFLLVVIGFEEDLAERRDPCGRAAHIRIAFNQDDLGIDGLRTTGDGKREIRLGLVRIDEVAQNRQIPRRIEVDTTYCGGDPRVPTPFTTM